MREPEEILEAALAAKLAAACTTPVIAYHAPDANGRARRLDGDTFVSVVAALASQDGDYSGRAPCQYTVTVSVRAAMADDPTGANFLAECRRVRERLRSLGGDGCTALSGDDFGCDMFALETTSPAFEGGDNPIYTKTYAATVVGRDLQTTTEDD